ncbi:MAG: fibronectin type III-like domain-contianing protein, partial [Novosphingobium sp.]
RLSAAQIARGDRFSVDVDVTNTGRRAGDEVVQLYIRDQVSSAPRPVLELKAFPPYQPQARREADRSLRPRAR